jgi:quercetin dioxygenase-like cupin family protein
MKRSILVLAAVGVIGSAVAQPISPAPILPGAVKWAPSAANPGLEAAWFLGSPEKQGMYVQRLRLASGAKVTPHTHPDERFSVVLSGTIHVGFGEVFDEHNVVAIPMGGIYVVPAGVPHYIWARDGDAAYQESGMGPTATNRINGNPR